MHKLYLFWIFHTSYIEPITRPALYEPRVKRSWTLLQVNKDYDWNYVCQVISWNLFDIRMFGVPFDTKIDDLIMVYYYIMFKVSKALSIFVYRRASYAIYSDNKTNMLFGYNIYNYAKLVLRLRKSNLNVYGDFEDILPCIQWSYRLKIKILSFIDI